MKTSKLAITLISSMLLILTYSCSQGQQSSAEATKGEAASSGGVNAALVNGKPIPMEELEVAVRNVVLQNGMDASHLDAFMGQFGPRILDQMVDGELLYQEALKQGFEASPERVDEAYSELAGRYPDPEQFQAEMEQRGFTEERLRENIAKQITIQSYIESTIVPLADVPDESLREAYDQNPQNFSTPEEVKASHILINSSESDPQEKKDEALKKAREIAAKARAEGADFAELARQYSEGPSAPSGGDLGYFSKGRMVKPFEDAAFGMKVNEVSDPVLTQFGYHVIKVTDRKEASTASFEDVKDELGQDLKNRMINELIGRKIADLRQSADIEILFSPTPPEAPEGQFQGQPMK